MPRSANDHFFLSLPGVFSDVYKCFEYDEYDVTTANVTVLNSVSKTHSLVFTELMQELLPRHPPGAGARAGGGRSRPRARAPRSAAGPRRGWPAGPARPGGPCGTRGSGAASARVFSLYFCFSPLLERTHLTSAGTEGQSTTMNSHRQFQSFQI